MVNVFPVWFVTMSYFDISHPSDKCLFNSLSSNSWSYSFFETLATKAVLVMFATNTFFILFIIKIKIIISAVSFGFAKLTANVMVNATEMAKVFGKRIDVFLKTEPTNAFINAIEFPPTGGNINPILRHELIQTRGKNGTYFHRILALKFAAWLDPIFEVWVYSKIEEILFGKAKFAGERISDLAIEEAKMENIRKEMQKVDIEVVKSFFVVERNIAQLKKNKNQAVNVFVKSCQPTLFDENLN